MGPRSCRLLRKYWGCLRIVAKAGDYYRSAFQLSRGVTQGEPLSPTILNVVMDAVVRHWVAVMAKGADKRSGYVQEVRHKNSLFYEDDGMVASSYPRWLQGALSTPAGMFDRVGLKTNVGRTVVMV